MEMSLVATLFPGIASLFVQDPVIACARIFMIIFGFILAYLGFKRTLEPLIMVPMGVGMICINCGVLFLDGGKLGTLFLDPLVSEPGALMNIMQINFLQPIYNLTFSNSLVACLVFMGIGAMCEIGFIFNITNCFLYFIPHNLLSFYQCFYLKKLILLANRTIAL